LFLRDTQIFSKAVAVAFIVQQRREPMARERRKKSLMLFALQKTSRH
jgi:hypothetical protein